MDSSVNWGLIRSGATFQSLANTLLFFEDPHARLFGRPGKDGAQDARSGDDKDVYQAKFHQNATASQAIADAKAELETIKEYRTPGHAHEPLWRGVEKWVLVTNAAFNPNDEKRWRDEVVPAFAAEGLDATEIWRRERLDVLLQQHPEVRAAYFEGENRVFLSLPEAHEKLLIQEVHVNALDVTFLGREVELQAIDDFLGSERQVLLAHGPGGIGKSRYLFETGSRAAANGWYVLWGNVEAMAVSSQWFRALIAEQPTLVLVDEPTSPGMIRVLLEQLSSGRAQQWKAVIATRTPKDPVLEVLRSPRLQPLLAPEVELAPLPERDAESFALSLLHVGTLRDEPADALERAAKELGRAFDRYPVWIALAVRLLEDKGNLESMPDTAGELSRLYLDEVIRFHDETLAPKAGLVNLIHWVGLYGTVSVEDRELITFLVYITGMERKSQVVRCLESLVARRFLVARGVRRRLHEIKPDVIRDHVVREWLTVSLGNADSRKASSEAGEVVELIIHGVNEKPIPLVEQVVRELARQEFGHSQF